MSLKHLHPFKALQVILLMACFSFLPALAFAQSGDAENRLRRLENEIDTLSRALYRGDTPPPSTIGRARDASANAALEVRLQQLETELRNLRGEIEKYGFDIRDLRTETDRRLSDIEIRLGDLEGTGTSATTRPRSATPIAQRPAQNLVDQMVSSPPARLQGGVASTQQIPPNAPFAVRSDPVPPGPEAQAARQQYTGRPNNALQPQDQAATSYENAFSLLKAGSFKQSQVAFEGFLNAYPDHSLVPNAQYWLGESFYVRREYERAARVFAEGYQTYPDSSKAPDNLLKLGLSLSGMGNNKDACVALQQLQSQFSGEKTPVMRRAEQEVSRLNCAG